MDTYQFQMQNPETVWDKPPENVVLEMGFEELFCRMPDECVDLILTDLWVRSGGLCEHILENGKRCCAPGVDIHHIVLKKMGGTKYIYTDDKLILVCRRHHMELHHIKMAALP